MTRTQEYEVSNNLSADFAGRYVPCADRIEEPMRKAFFIYALASGILCVPLHILFLRSHARHIPSMMRLIRVDSVK